MNPCNGQWGPRATLYKAQIIKQSVPSWAIPFAKPPQAPETARAPSDLGGDKVLPGGAPQGAETAKQRGNGGASALGGVAQCGARVNGVISPNG